MGQMLPPLLAVPFHELLFAADAYMGQEVFHIRFQGGGGKEGGGFLPQECQRLRGQFGRVGDFPALSQKGGGEELEDEIQTQAGQTVPFFGRRG